MVAVGLGDTYVEQVPALTDLGSGIEPSGGHEVSSESHAEPFKATGVNDFVHVRSDVHAVLSGQPDLEVLMVPNFANVELQTAQGQGLAARRAALPAPPKQLKWVTNEQIAVKPLGARTPPRPEHLPYIGIPPLPPRALRVHA